MCLFAARITTTTATYLFGGSMPLQENDGEPVMKKGRGTHYEQGKFAASFSTQNWTNIISGAAGWRTAKMHTYMGRAALDGT